MPDRDLTVPSEAVQLRVLGGVDLHGPSGEAVDAVVNQSKRLALLVYLALAGSGRFVRRDSLLALFWPESDAKRGRAALRKSLSFLRKHLGAQVLTTRADDVAVDRNAVWCDAVAFEAACGQRLWSDALKLYRGDLLDGFFVASAAGFERWLDDERPRFRSLAASAYRRQIEAAEQAGDNARAIDVAHRLLQIVPDDEDALRRLLSALEHEGDRAAALQAYDRFVVRLREDLDLEPAPETDALVERIRHRQVPRTVDGMEPPRQMMQRDLIAVLPFEIRGADEFHYLREGMVDLLAAKLDGAGDLRTVDPPAILGYLRSSETTDIDVTAARNVAAHFGAGAFVLGSVIVAAERWQVRATIYDLVGDREVRVDVEATPDAGLFGIVDEFTLRLLASRSDSVGGHLGRLGAMTSDSMDAVKSYLAGERAFRRGCLGDAGDAYTHAIEADGDFALAHYRLASTRSACGKYDDAVAACGAARLLRRRVTPHVRVLLDAQDAWFHGDVPLAEKLYTRILSDWPDDVEAWYHVGHLQLAYNAYRGRPAREACTSLERVIELDPTHVGALEDLAHVAVIERNDAAVEQLASRILAVEPSHDRVLRARSQLALVLAPDTLAKLGGEVGTSRPRSIATTLGSVFVGATVREAMAFVSAVADAAPRSAIGGLAHVLRASLSLEEGARDAYQEHMRMAHELDDVSALEFECLLASMLPEEFAPSERGRLFESLERFDGVTSSAGGTWPPPAHRAIRPQLHLYLKGLGEVIAGDHARALSRADECAAVKESNPMADMACNFAHGVRAAVAAKEGDAARALEHLDMITIGGWFLDAPASPFLALTRERWLRASILRDLGRTTEADRYEGTLGERSAFERILKS